jgi:hypothetical protein
MSEPNQHVKHHLEKNGVDPSSLPDSVIDALNDCSPDELNAMERVGQSLIDTNVDSAMAVKAVH